MNSLHRALHHDGDGSFPFRFLAWNYRDLVSPFMDPLGILLLLPSTVGPMTPPSAANAIDAIFDRPRGAAAILFWVEDCSSTVPIPQCLRDTYLPSLLAVIESTNPSDSVSPFTPGLLPYQLLPFGPRHYGCPLRNMPRSSRHLTRPTKSSAGTISLPLTSIPQ